MDLSDEAQKLWAAAQAVNRAAAAVSPAAAALPPLLFFTDPVRTPAPWVTATRLPEGAAVVYRGFGLPEAEAVARRLRRVTAERGVRLLIGLDAALAERVGADGVHLPQRALSAAYSLGARRPDWLITGAVHDAAAAAAARDLHALVLSPVFQVRADDASARRTPLGIEGFARLAACAPAPVYALGGIGPDQAEALIGSGGCGLAGAATVSRAFA